MSEEYLEALKTIKIKCHPNSNPSPLVDEALKVVEQALQRLEAIDNAKPSEALDNIKSLLKDDWVESVWKTDYEIIKQSLLKAQEYEEENKRLWNDITTVSKQYTDLMLDYQEQKRVLEIINKKNVDIIYLKDSNNVEEYNSHFGAVVCKLTPEEYDAVKKWLG